MSKIISSNKLSEHKQNKIVEMPQCNLPIKVLSDDEIDEETVEISPARFRQIAKSQCFPSTLSTLETEEQLQKIFNENSLQNFINLSYEVITEKMSNKKLIVENSFQNSLSGFVEGSWCKICLSCPFSGETEETHKNNQMNIEDINEHQMLRPSGCRLPLQPSKHILLYSSIDGFNYLWNYYILCHCYGLRTWLGYNFCGASRSGYALDIPAKINCTPLITVDNTYM